MKKQVFIFMVFLLIESSVLPGVWSTETKSLRMPLTFSLENEAQHALKIGIQWLEAQQQEEGCWSNPMFPAITALAVSAILNSPDVVQSATMPESAERGLKFILDSMQPDGCIYRNIEGPKGGGMPNYNTSLCLMALADARDPKYDLIIDRARTCLIGKQHLGQDVFGGGMGYDAEKNRAYADLSNTVLALEALWRTQPPADSLAAGGAELDWEAAIGFVSRCQHLRETNNMHWVSDSMEQRGGFIYNPEETKVVPESGDENPGVMHSYGSMTYAGLLSFIYAKVNREDIRVKAAYDWITRNWNLDENPRMGAQGLYYYYLTLAKALNAYGQETISLPGGKKLEWRPALIKKLVSLQKIDPETGFGYWQNENNRWWENDPNLVTAYTLLALEVAMHGVTPSAP